MFRVEMKWLQGRLPCADPKKSTKSEQFVSSFQENLEAPVMTTTDMTEKRPRSEVGEGLLMLICKQN
jgi:hypothetical protein